MAIKNLELSNKFHIWVSLTNQVIKEVNENLVLEAKQKLKTLHKETLIDAINEIYDSTLRTDSDSVSSYDITAQTLQGNIKLKTGSEGNGNSYIEFWDDSDNLFRKIVFNHNDKEWYVERGDGTLLKIIREDSYINGNNNTLTIKTLPHYLNVNYVGPLGEFVYDYDWQELYIHDGETKGGLNVPIKANDKVKINDEDKESGYLSDKLESGTGIDIKANSQNDKIVVTNTLTNEFTNQPIANTYLKRNALNNMYIPVTIDELKKDLKIDELLNSVIKTGTIISSIRTANYDNWLLCNGQAVSRTEYSELFNLIGINFGVGDGKTTFNVPDYRGKFLRGLGGNSESSMYITQKEGLPDHNHTLSFNSYPMEGGKHYNWVATEGTAGERITNNASDSNPIYGSNEHVTPINQAVNFFIKAK